MNLRNCVGMLFMLALVLVAAAPYSSATEPSNGFYNVALTENCNQWYFWTQNSTFTGVDAGWNYASGYQYGCNGIFGTFNDGGFEVVIKKGQPPNDNEGSGVGSNRSATDVELSDLYWCLFIGDCTDSYVYLMDIATDTSTKHLNSEVTLYVDGDTFIYVYAEQPIVVTSDGAVFNLQHPEDASHASLPALGTMTPANPGAAKADEGIRAH